MVHFGAFWVVFFVCVLVINISAWSGDLVDVEDVLLWSREFSVRVMGLVSFLLHFNASYLVLKFWNMTKLGGNFTPNSGWNRPRVPSWIIVIYAHDGPTAKTYGGCPHRHLILTILLYQHDNESSFASRRHFIHAVRMEGDSLMGSEGHYHRLPLIIHRFRH